MSHDIHADVPELDDALATEIVDSIFQAAAQVVDIPTDLNFSVAIVDEDTIQSLNKTYREKDEPTDVLSFRYDDQSAEIVLCARKIVQQAEEFGHSVRTEAAFMLVHGILHTLGWDHERSKKEAQEQRKLEHDILRLCGLDFAR